jgi:DNA-binding NarL/FixJ family response regulator
MASLRISVVSDDRLFCESVMRILADMPDLTVTPFEDASVPAAVRSGAHHVCIVDARMRGVLRWCTMEGAASVILAGAPDDDAWAEEALTLGAQGILTKTSRSEDLGNAIHVVAEGGIWARRRWLNASLKYFAASRKKPAPPEQLGSLLSARERQVFHHAAMGARNKELADRLAISEATVKVHLTHIFQKLGVSGRAELAAVYHGLLPAVADSPRPAL